jgi:hypothetical protein
MITGIVLGMLGLALIVVLWAMFRAPAGAQSAVAPVPVQAPAAKAMAAAGRLEADAWDAKPGDVVSILGAAEDFSDLDFPVDRRSAYESGNFRWVDLSGEFRGRRVYLEVYRHPQHEFVGLLDARRLSLADIGVTEDQLADMDTRQDPSAFVQFEGKKWSYESSRELGYFENETGPAEGLYRWLFQGPDLGRLICIEKWVGEPFDVRIACRLNQRDITVYRAA